MRLLMALMCLVTFAAPAAERVVAFDVPEWHQPTPPLHIAGPIYYVGTKDLAVYLIVTPAGHIMLDGGVPGTEPLIEASIRQLGFDPHDIHQLIISHAHFDHVGTLAYFRKLTQAPLAVMAPDDELLKSGGRADYLYADLQAFHFQPVTADRVLKDGDTVTLGNVTMTARHTPGHTRGCTTWVMNVSDGGNNYRVVFAGSTSVNPGTHLLHAPSYPGIADDYRRSFEVLASLQPDLFLSAHASFFNFAAKRELAISEGVKAFVDPQGYASANNAKRAAFEALIAKEGQQ
jgi:metallo-beta-lactamase class B